VDASQGSEEMVVHLSDKVLHQEELIQQLEEEKNDLASSMNSLSAAVHAVCLIIFYVLCWSLFFRGGSSGLLLHFVCFRQHRWPSWAACSSNWV